PPLSPKAAPPPPEPTAVVNETPEPPAPQSIPATPPTPVDTQSLWIDALTAVRRDRPLISTWLEAGALLEITGNKVRIGFPPDQTMAMESLLRANNRTFLEDLFTRLAGDRREVECLIREGLVVEHVNLPSTEPVQVDPMEDFKNDPLIRKALELFQAEIQPA
ncbi:MAG: hypothetical protein ABSE62_15570, partial [Chthoniobacteraceae bacterium]